MRSIINFINWFKGAIESESVQYENDSKLMRPIWYLFRLIRLISKYFIEKRIHVRAAALTYYSAFAIVPILAFVLAISRGFGFDSYVQSLLVTRFQSHADFVMTIFKYADNYLGQAKGGALVGAGIAMLLWSVFRMFNQIERVFNDIWAIEIRRPWKYRIPNYIAIVFFVPILILITGGVSLYFKYAIQYFQDSILISPSLKLILFFMPMIVTWLTFTLLYWFVPNTQVKFRYAAVAGLLFGGAFYLFKFTYFHVQSWMTTYNAVYGALAAIPFFLLFIQFSWVLVLVGCSFVFTTQCLRRFEHAEDVKKMSHKYYEFAALVVTKMCVEKWNKGKEYITLVEIADKMPYRMAKLCVDKLCRAGILDKVLSVNDELVGYRPKDDLSELSISKFYLKLDGEGTADDRFKLHINPEYEYLWEFVDSIRKNMLKTDDRLIKYLEHDYTIEP